MVNVECTVNYFDRDLKKNINIGDQYSVPEARAEVLVLSGVAKVVTTPTEVVTEPAAKKKTTKKASK